VYWPSTVFFNSTGGMHFNTFTFSSRTSSAARLTGGSMATSVITCVRWFCITSRMMPNLSK